MAFNIEIKTSLRNRHWLISTGLALLALFVVGITLVVSVSVGKVLVKRVKSAYWRRLTVVTEKARPRIPVSKLPGPPRRWEKPSFVLNDRNAQRMTGMDDPVNQRWCDVAGNFYATKFIRGFSYARPGPQGPAVWVRVEPRADTLRGRLEARGLKPNFGYQIKLRGVFSDRESFETIGFAGRWRLPGRPTNYRDEDYLDYPAKEHVEAYILFDFFITDAQGNAVREFALDSTLHVLFNAARQGQPASVKDAVPVIVDASDASRYARPKSRRSLEFVWAQREGGRYESAGQIVRLPEGRYHAMIVLVEESFHSSDNDGGFWPTVCRVPVEFVIDPRAVSSNP